ncbi:type II toxin-antitoxin system prevent-host-death family antitoxin [Chloroflexi bacterium TSY]|nr:type II toxin-antitoxin system prevent-host-death family antitoxin [Chloroflexi bacterium TSY]
MDKIQQFVPITEMRLRHSQVLELLDNGPVILAQRSKPTAVLVNVDMWDNVAEYIDELEATIDALMAELKIARGETETYILAENEIAEWAGEDEKIPT